MIAILYCRQGDTTITQVGTEDSDVKSSNCASYSGLEDVPSGHEVIGFETAYDTDTVYDNFDKIYGFRFMTRQGCDPTADASFSYTPTTIPDIVMESTNTQN